ncbi:MAG: hypothetical protein GY711_16845 [bacterium]|nr:hypothetical protein [bacterium]
MAKPDRLAKQLVDIALDVLRRGLWLEVPEEAPFLIQRVGDEHGLCALVFGQFGEPDNGVLLVRGVDALEKMQELVRAGLEWERHEDVDLLYVTVCHLGEIPGDLRAPLEAAGFHGRGEVIAPALVVRRPRGDRRAPNRGEMKLLLASLRAIGSADDAGKLRPDEHEPALGSVLELGVTAQGRELEVRTREVDVLEVTDEASASTEGFGRADWKSASDRLTRRLSEILRDRNLVNSHTLELYFGDSEFAEEVLEEWEHLGPYVGFAEWLIGDFQATPRSRTLAEKELRRPDLPAAERTLLEARRVAALSIYRIDAAEEAMGTLEVEDVVSGDRHTIEDSALASCEIEDTFLPLRLFAVGSHTFCTVTGPPLTGWSVDRALAFLAEEGVEIESLRRAAHRVGLLWGFFLEEQELGLELHNTDGDPIESHTAVFGLEDPGALIAALAERPDIDADAQGGVWTWFRPDAPAGMGDQMVLGTLELIDDRLVVEVDSANRFEAAREWLEKIRGVRFEVVSAREFLDPDGPLDDRLPGPPPEPPTAEMTAHLEKMFLDRCRVWLDEPVPALGELTPRAAAATPEGRERVARLVRTMPSMMHPDGKIEPPREEMLRELGIE